MGSPPASLKAQRSQRNFSFNFLLRGQKVKNNKPFGQLCGLLFCTPSGLSVLLHLRRIVLYVCRPLNGKHKINTLCALCGFAVNKILNINLMSK